MTPPSKPQEEPSNVDRIKQIAKRKEQNRNAQRRLRERKEEYTMQLEAQVAELHRRSQNQEEQSHFLREMLDRIRSENQMLTQQLALVTGSPEMAHRASVDATVLASETSVHPAMNRPRHASESNAASSRGMGWFPGGINPNQAAGMTQYINGAAIAPHEEASGPHFLDQSAGLPSSCGNSTYRTVLHPEIDSISRLPDASLHLGHPVSSSRRSSASLHVSASDGLLSPLTARGVLNRNGSGQTDITVPSEGSDAESPASMASLSNVVRTDGDSTMDLDHLDVAASRQQDGGPVDMIKASFGSGLAAAVEARDMPAQGQHPATSTSQFMQPWLSTDGEHLQQELILSSMPSTDLASHAKPFQATPSALGLSLHGDAWTISPWMNLTSSPVAQLDSQTSVQTDSVPAAAEDSDRPPSLAYRRGFSGKLHLQPPGLQ